MTSSGSSHVTDPQPLGLFNDAVYDRGAAAIHALRHQVGDDAFFAATRLWLTRYEGSTATTEDFQRGLRGGVRPGSRRVLRHLAAPAREALAALTDPRSDHGYERAVRICVRAPPDTLALHPHAEGTALSARIRRLWAPLANGNG